MKNILNIYSAAFVFVLMSACSGSPSNTLADQSPQQDAAQDAALIAVQDAEPDAVGIKISAGAFQFEEEQAPKARAKPQAAAQRRKKQPKKEAARPHPPRARTAMGTIRAHMGDVQHCYGRVALKDPSIAGRITLQWTLGRTGMPIATAVIKDTLKDKSVAKCLRKRAKRWRFPEPKGGTGVITYPFDLRVQ